jgi:cobaltochelatase CobS
MDDSMPIAVDALPVPVPYAPPRGSRSDDSALDALARALGPKITGAAVNRADVEKIVNETLKSIVMPTIEIKIGDAPAVKIKGVSHSAMADLSYYVARRRHVYLHGPAGTGKTHATQQIAESMNLKWGYGALNPQTPASFLLGYKNAGGGYERTPFRDVYEHGGVFCIDEMDNASDSLLTTLNGMIANGHGAFPDGMVSRHNDFVLVCTGNTNGNGANAQFPGRRAFDAAFKNRFRFLYWGYDEKMESALTIGRNPDKGAAWFAYVKELRAHCIKNYPRILVSPRASYDGADELRDGRAVRGILDAIIFQGADKDTVDTILRACPIPAALKGGK